MKMANTLSKALPADVNYEYVLDLRHGHGCPCHPGLVLEFEDGED